LTGCHWQCANGDPLDVVGKPLRLATPEGSFRFQDHRTKIGRVRPCRLGLRRLDEEAAWIERYRQLWDARFDELDKVVEELKRKEKVDGRKKRE
jgi:hypothetical protein